MKHNEKITELYIEKMVKAFSQLEEHTNANIEYPYDMELWLLLQTSWSYIEDYIDFLRDENKPTSALGVDREV